MNFSENEKLLIDALIDHWRFWDLHEDFYLTKLAPSLVSDPTRGDAFEKETLQKLRQLISQEDWLALPKLIAERRAEILREIEIQSAQRKAREREKQEAAHVIASKREEEHRERLRQESLREQAEAKRNELLQEVSRRLRSDFLGADSFFRDSCADLIPQDDYEREKISFVKSWIADNTPSDKNGQQRLPDDEQAAAIAAVHGHVQVVSRAGSGKTTTLVNRALFLRKHCGVSPSEMLLLAFNRKAALEIRRRLLVLLSVGADAAVAADVNHRIHEVGKHKTIDKDKIEADAVDAVATRLNVALPHVMTFHALARSVVFSDLRRHGIQAPDLLVDREFDQTQSRTFQRVIDDYLQDSALKEQIRELMLAHFREDWDRIVDGHYDSKEQLLHFRRSLPRKSLGGEDVKSFGEKVIADFLFEHDIPYKYECNHWWNDINYRPDFTIFQTPKSGTIIEYFGLKGDADYDEMSEEKRAYWSTKQGWALVEVSPHDIVINGVDSFLTLLKDRLEDQGTRCVRLSEDEIWHRIKDRAIDRFSKAVGSFIGRCRKRSLSPEELRSLINSHSPTSHVEKMFLDLAHQFYVSYLDRLSETGEEDFDGLMQRAAETIDAGQTLFQRKSGSGDLALLRYVCIDEFQDFSNLFYRLLSAIRKQNQQIALFCVGDDWQAINGFAGSDLRFFENFADYIAESRRLYISTNYRSMNRVVAVGNALMEGFGKPALAHKKSAGNGFVCDLNEFEPSKLEEERHGRGDNITPAVLRLVGKGLADGMDVVILNRTNTINWYVEKFEAKKLHGFLESIRCFFPKGLKERISISTAHKYKGLEKPMVIVLDAVSGSYPLVHPDWVFSRVLGDGLEKIIREERRLLYVALTRAVEKVVIVTHRRNKPPFLEELERRHPLSAIDWVEYPPICGQTTRLLVKVGNQNDRKIKNKQGSWDSPTYAIKDLLKASGYRYEKVNWACWAKSFPAQAFSVETIKAEIWTEPADGIEVRIFDDNDTLAGRFLIDAGKWHFEVVL